MNKKALIPMAVLAALAVPGIAAAHNATATPSCGGLSWSAFNYDKTVVNSITVTVDGSVVHADPDFKASDSGAATWSQTANHTWSVVVNAPGTQYDKSFSGTWQACVATTTTVAPTTTEPAATTTVPDATTTSVVAVDIPPVPTTVAPATTVATDISTVNPALPATGAAGTVFNWACILFFVGAVAIILAARRRDA